MRSNPVTKLSPSHPSGTAVKARIQPRDDATLVSGVRAGDPGAFAAVYDRHSGKLFALCLRMLRDHTDAEDALQQAFFDAWRSMENSSGEIRLGPWLNQIA